ncbi:MAG: helix-turn-helix transcriptional regulator [Cyanobacteria bacterium SIG28]|nr:helix-turn-helix transcriptional regulator [Cyanobacteria bacterium SIG28]
MIENEILKIIADNIRLERLKKRISQEELAEKAEISTKYLNMIENYKSNPTIVVVIKICKALEINIDKICQ